MYGLYRGYIGIMENNMETTIMGYLGSREAVISHMSPCLPLHVPYRRSMNFKDASKTCDAV